MLYRLRFARIWFDRRAGFITDNRVCVFLFDKRGPNGGWQ